MDVTMRLFLKSYVFSTHFNIILPSIPILFFRNIRAQIGTRETPLSFRLYKQLSVEVLSYKVSRRSQTPTNLLDKVTYRIITENVRTLK